MTNAFEQYDRGRTGLGKVAFFRHATPGGLSVLNVIVKMVVKMVDLLYS
jgi:hypothetical protein